MTPTQTENVRLARQCREALGSLYCDLTNREKRVLNVLVDLSFGLGLDAAFVGSSDQLALLARLHKTDVSSAISSIKRTRLIQWERAQPLLHFRKPMLYRVLPNELMRLASEPVLATGSAIDKVRAATAAWLVHANRCYPLQPDLLPPDPNELELALAEISRASALAVSPLQNEEPKPGHVAGEAYPSAQPTRPGLASLSSVQEAPPDAGLPSSALSRAFAESLAQSETAAAVAPEPSALFRLLEGAETAPPVVGDFQTTSPPSLKSSNYGPSRVSDVSDDSDGERNLSIRNPDGDARGPVGNFQTEPAPGYVLEASMLLAKWGQPWTPPTAAQQVFELLTACMGGAMGNYSGWWWPKCADPLTRRDVLEAIATWKLARLHPRHKPWRGGAWRDEYHRRQKERLKAEEREGAGGLA